ncbi:TPA: phage terminase small subunit P27 family [Burkholderia vietnamiensis]|uniref:phage terminase small subunit P27 family n=1 Tax=Burkholderia vietnamiensis TaxID=60552 RepID=UPI00075A5A3E|nr:phage terminase small subunit P27 family [Burkholderia vietnamiensis]KVF97017.1 terminase [Burkholderia vietnamiensis]UKV72846.1 phage terminase small subunit P27 family [Burkholderia vietnamiensis]CAG9197051.1 Putative phage terminase, small subunit P27 family [Burkholderia vietnamiensis]HDR8962499.1 phage terminase small subunit P27 family [Burkholderia vietnamiensis]HDR9203779.1 phage terminase small subunit P27 family [Burkholderia vietnamiensis]
MPGVAGRSGRRPKPVARKEAAGNPGKRQLNTQEPDFGLVTNIEPPEWLDPQAVEMWERVAPLLCKQKILQFTDLHNVEIFCAAYGNWRRAQEQLAREGPVVMGAQGGPVKNPAATVVKEAAGQMATFGAMLGLDPSSRQRLIGPKKQNAGNPFADLLG